MAALVPCTVPCISIITEVRNVVQVEPLQWTQLCFQQFLYFLYSLFPLARFDHDPLWAYPSGMLILELLI